MMVKTFHNFIFFTVCFILASSPAPGGETAGRYPSHPMGVPESLLTAYSSKLFFNIDENDAKVATRIWTESVLKRRGSQGYSETVIFYDLPSLERMIKDKKVELVAMLSEEFLEIRNRVPLVPIAVSSWAKGFYKEFALLVRTNSGTLTLSELKNKRLIIEKGRNGTLPAIWLETLLMKDGNGGAEDFFSNVKYAGKASQAVLPVFFGQADACVVSRSGLEAIIELNPQVGRELLEIAVSPGFVRGVLCVRKDYCDRYEEFIQESLMTLHREPQGRQILTLFSMSKLIPIEDRYLDSTEALLREHQSLKMRIARKAMRRAP